MVDRIYYCKSLKKTGKPIVVENINTKKTRTTGMIQGYGHWKVEYNNAKGKSKRSGATTTLLVWK